VLYHHQYKNVTKDFQNASHMLFLADKMSSVYHGTRSAEKIQDIKKILCGGYGAKERAEKYAQELKKVNEQLRKVAFKDGLTALYNHRFFQDLMDHELSRARR
jgi:hypothetical protein